MYTSAEIQLLRNADPGVKIPGIDTPTGNPLATTSLKPLGALPSSGSITYSPGNNTVYVKQAGAVLSGYDFGSATVMVEANNVTIQDCSFGASATNWYSIQVANGCTNTTITNYTFNSEDAASAKNAWVVSAGQVTITNNSFIDSPSDALDLTGSGVVSGNYFSGAGNNSTGAHPDGIWITDSSGPFSITDNFIDWTADPNETVGPNDCIRITAELGSVSNVTVSGNFLLGGSANIQASGGTEGTFSNISITGNYLGFADYYAFYPSPATGVTTSGNVIFDYTNPGYAASAWAAYEKAGVPTPNLLVSASGSTVSASGTGPTTLYGSLGAHLFGGSAENNFVAGFGREFIFGGAGANVFTFINPNRSDSPSEISNFDPAKDVIGLSHIDANLTAAGVQNFTFIGTNALTSAGAQVDYVQDAATDTTTVQATLAGDTTPDLVFQIAGLFTLTAANFGLTSSQSTTDLAAGATLSFSTLRSGSANEYSYTNVQGRPYSSYQAIDYANEVAADDLNLSGSSNEIDLFENNATITRGNSAERFAIGNGSFNLAYHANETIQAGDAGAETFAFSSGFGNETIDGFATGANPDTLQLSISAFSYLNNTMTQAQDLAAVLSHVSTATSSATITDSNGDSLTLAGVTASTLAANPTAVKFV
ncbi:hypothetical protein [Roseiarcus sp.]|uniref:hypothetical protein n=1 Tax=Roseiarcus sp. TaxID=1969460 RepID=UPI003F96DC70